MRKKIFLTLFLALFIFGSGFYASKVFEAPDVTADDLSLDEQEATVRAIEKVMPSVVSIVVHYEEELNILDMNTGKTTTSKEKKLKGSGTGFIISADGLILTNKHVVSTTNEKSAEYRIILASGKKYYAQLIGKDPLNDLAVLKIFDKDLPYVELGNSKDLKLGTSVIAIGNALGIYQNSVTKGIISGIERNIVASDGNGTTEELNNVIQTDAEINLGNSGGPLINLKGEVVGVNVALDKSGGSIGFSIPINDAKPVIRTVKEIGRIVRPKVGIYYFMLTEEIALENNLPRSEGAWVYAGDDLNISAISPDSPASRAGILDGDIIFEINAIKINKENKLLDVVQRYKPGDKIGLKIQRGDKIIIKVVELGEF